MNTSPIISNKKVTVRNSFAFLLYVAVLSCLALNCYTHASIDIQHPLVLCIACLLAIPRFLNTPKIVILQKIILLYCLSILFNQAALRFFRLQWGVLHLEISYAFILLLPLMAQYLIKHSHLSQDNPSQVSSLNRCWALLVTLLCIHILLLFAILKSIYGYGYEHSPAVLASLCLYFLVYLFTWETLTYRWHTRITALICLSLWTMLSLSQGI